MSTNLVNTPKNGYKLLSPLAFVYVIHRCLLSLQWSPDGKTILFGITNGEIHIYDNIGNIMVSAAVYSSMKPHLSSS